MTRWSTAPLAVEIATPSRWAISDMLEPGAAATTYRSFAWAIVMSIAVNSGAWTAMSCCWKSSKASSARWTAGRACWFGIAT